MSSTKSKSARAMKTAQKSDKENCQPINGRKSKLPVPAENVAEKKTRTRAKPAPNFNKLHSQWTSKLQIGKACRKKPCTVSQEFNLTRPGSKAQVKAEEVTPVKGLDVQAGGRQCFTPDAKSMKDLELNRELSPSQQSGRATIATSRLTSDLEKGILQESQSDHPIDRHRPPAKRSKPNATMSLADQQKQADLPFKTDKSALSSILTNSGIENRPSVVTPNKQCQRVSIYYQAQNRVSLFDNCVKKRLMTVPSTVEKVTEADRICITESPYVKGARVKPVRNSVYPEYVRRTFLTPSTPKGDTDGPISAVSASTARRVPNPNYKGLGGSVNKIRKTLRWGDILASPNCTLKPDNQKSLEEKERQLLHELQQLNMAMSDEHKQDDNDNNHPHPHQHDLTHHQQQQEQQLLTQQHQQSSRRHPDTSGVSDVIHHLLTPSSRQPQIPYQRQLPGVTISNVSTTLTHSSVTQGLQLGVPSDINSNVTRVAPGPCPPAPAESQLGGIQVTQSQIQQQLLAVQQSQLELLRVQQQLEQRLRQSQMSCGAQPDQSEHNNNTDLKCNTQSIPPCGPEQGPSQPACRQEQTQMKSGDINDNYQQSSSAGAAPHLVTDSCDSDEEVKSMTTSSSAVHAGRGLQSTQSDFSLSSSNKRECISNIEQSVQSKSHESGDVSSEGRHVSSTSEQFSQGSSENVQESVTHDSSAPLSPRAPCKLPLLREELELTPDVVSGTRKTHSPVPVTSIALGLSMPQPNRPSQATFEEHSPPTITPPIWTPLALKVAASRSSPKGDDSNVPSLKLDEESVCSDEREIPDSSSEPSETCKRQCVEVSEESRFRSLLQETKSSAFDQVVPASVTLVTSSLTSVTLSATSPLPAKQARHVPSDSDIYLDALLDDECALFTCRLQTFFRDVSEPERGVQDPVARTLMEGDDMHFVPIHDDLVTTTTLEGSAFSAYSRFDL